MTISGLDSARQLRGEESLQGDRILIRLFSFFPV